MSRTNLLFGFSAVALAAMLAAMTTSTAQIARPPYQDSTAEAQSVPQVDQAVQREVRRADADEVSETPRARMHSRNGQQSAKHIVRASDVIGHEIVNAQDENVGEISDLVLDPSSGKIRYAAVTYGGFAGLGDKMFAVPWEAFQCRPEADDPDEYVVMLDVRQESLENAQGFDQDNWPNFADRNFTDKIDQQYGVQRNQAGQRPMVDEERGGVEQRRVVPDNN